MHPRTLAAASRLTFLIVAGLQIPVAVDRLSVEYSGRIAATWLAWLGAACEAAGWLTLLAIAVWGQFTAKGRRNDGERLATAAVLGGAMAIVGEAFHVAERFGLESDWGMATAPARLFSVLRIHAERASAAIACTVLAVTWRCSVGRRGRQDERSGTPTTA